ncbi:MAG: hypothetical protein R3F37_23975, partial [Candidatus Competibacteraceae bacterium]
DVAALKSVPVNTTLDAGALLIIGGNLAAAMANFENATRLLQRSMVLSRDATPKQFPEIGLLAFQALGQATLAQLLSEAAVETRGWVGRGGPPLPKNKAALNSAIDLYYSAALSNMEYVDALFTAGLAERSGVDLGSAQNHLRRHDPTYLMARGGLEQIDRLPNFFAQDDAKVFAQLGALLMTVSNSALLVAQHYSLSARTDDIGRVVGFGREQAANKMGELADQEALRAIAEAAEATDGASTPMLAASLDAARRNRDVAVISHDRLMALGLRVLECNADGADYRRRVVTTALVFSFNRQSQTAIYTEFASNA